MEHASSADALAAPASRGLADIVLCAVLFYAGLSRAGASTHEIAAAGGWKSAGMVIRYTRRETAKRGAVAKYLEER